MTRVLIAIAVLLGSAVPLAADSGFSAKLFAKFQSRACTICHDFHEKQLGGLAFASHRGRSVEMCIVCHSKAVTGFRNDGDWFAQPGLYTSAMDARQTCEATKDALHGKFKSRVLLARQLETHLLEDPRVLWAIEGATPSSGVLPGGKHETGLVKGGLETWRAEVKAWIEGGMECR